MAGPTNKSKEAQAAEALAKSKKELAQLEPLLKRIKTVHTTHEHSDLLIKCKDREWKVHKLVVCSQSGPIDAAVRSFKEGEDGVYTMDGQDPQVVEGLIHYLYNFDYKNDGSDHSDVAGIVFDVRMSILADEYLVTPLSALASEKFEHRSVKEWASADFAKAVSQLYQNGSDANVLRKVAISTIKAHANEVFDVAREAEFSALLQVFRTTELGVDISRALAAGALTRTYQCGSCCSKFDVCIPKGCRITCPKNCNSTGFTADFWSSFAFTN